MRNNFSTPTLAYKISKKLKNILQKLSSLYIINSFTDGFPVARGDGLYEICWRCLRRFESLLHHYILSSQVFLPAGFAVAKRFESFSIHYILNSQVFSHKSFLSLFSVSAIGATAVTNFLFPPGILSREAYGLAAIAKFQGFSYMRRRWALSERPAPWPSLLTLTANNVSWTAKAGVIEVPMPAFGAMVLYHKCENRLYLWKIKGRREEDLWADGQSCSSGFSIYPLFAGGGANSATGWPQTVLHLLRIYEKSLESSQWPPAQAPPRGWSIPGGKRKFVSGRFAADTEKRIKTPRQKYLGV